MLERHYSKLTATMAAARLGWVGVEFVNQVSFNTAVNVWVVSIQSVG
jgi:hypothetical protein